jgi:thymidylate synthase
MFNLKFCYWVNNKMFDVIISTTKEYGIGFEDGLIWECSKKLELLKKLTIGGILIVGRKSYEYLPKLNDRTVIMLSENIDKNDENVFCSIRDVEKKYNDNVLFITGGAKLYNEVFSDRKESINKVHMFVMNGEYKCDTFLNFNPMDWTIKEKTVYDDFIHYVYIPKISEESCYLKLLKDVFENGWTKKGRNGNTKSMFGKTLEFDLRNGFPLLTTKKMFWRGVVEELLFFIRGDTDTKLLSDKKIKIWEGNTSREFLDSIGKKRRRVGVMGPMYGSQWRNFNAEYDEQTASSKEPGLDQLKMVIQQIRKDPYSRRLLMTDFNPLQANEGVLLPCHSIIIQFYVQEGFLDIFCFNRSQDLFLGTPFNIASTALLLTFIASITNLIPRKMVLSLGDCHIYEDHLDAVRENLYRVPFDFPRLKITKELKELEDIEKIIFNDIQLIGYNYYPPIKANMII